MEANKILKANLLDLIFENRNKDYGAYELRRSYNKRIHLALLVTAGLVAGIIIGQQVSNALRKEIPVLPDDRVVIVETPPDEPVKEKVAPPPPPPPAAPPPQRVETIQFTPPQIVKDEDVNKDDIPPETDQLESARISVTTQTGVPDDGTPVVQPADERGVVAAPPPAEPEEIFREVEVDAEFPGGSGAWVRFLQKNLNGSVPVDNGAPEGSYTVIIQFIVNKEGNVSDIKAVTQHGYGLEEEAIRVMKKALKWTPALQNGRQVNAYRKQPITFVVANQ